MRYRAWMACVLMGLGLTASSASAAPIKPLTAVSGQSMPATDLPLMPAPAQNVVVPPEATKPLPESAKLPYEPEYDYIPELAPCCKGNCCDPCGPPGRIWAGFEVLGWSVRGMATPPLITGSPLGTPLNQAGVLGAPNTVVLFGGDRLDSDLRVGYRITAGAWLDKCQKFGIEASYFQLDDIGSSIRVGGAGGPGIVARPFVNAAPGLEGQAVELIDFPGVVSGDVTVRTNSRLLGGDVNFRHNLSCSGDPCNGYRIDLLYGYRYLNLHERLSVFENLLNQDPTRGPVGTRILVFDSFTSSNRFHGGQIGLAGEKRFGWWFVDGFGKIAVGNTFREIEQLGVTQITVPGTAPVASQGGLLVQRSNLGRFSRDDFSIVPEIGFRVGVSLGGYVRLWTGYNLLYWTNVARPGMQIDTAVNSTQIPPGTLVGPAQPAFFDRTGEIWAQGISGGLEVRY